MATKSTQTWRVIDLITWTTGYFQKRGIPSARLDAELLLAHVLGVERLQLYLRFHETVPPSQLARYRELVRKRAERVPVAYLTHEREFMGLNFYVDERVLIPRPETETLVEIVESHAVENNPQVLEIGTGCGAIAISLAKRLGWSVVATDLSEDALEVARGNAETHGVAAQITFLQGDLFEPLAPDQRFDWILSNPPYIPSAVLSTLQPEIAHEPPIALDGGSDGMAVLRRLIKQAPEHLQPGGRLLLEIGHDQGNALRAFMRAQPGWATWEILQDHSRTERFLFACKVKT